MERTGIEFFVPSAPHYVPQTQLLQVRQQFCSAGIVKQMGKVRLPGV